MRRPASPALLLAAMIIGGATSSSCLAFSYGPNDGETGAPGEITCAYCHGSLIGTGQISITGVPVNYHPGTPYLLTVHLQSLGQSVWGFEITAIDANGNGAGDFAITDVDNTQLSDNGSPQRDYMKQSAAGSFPNIFDGPVTWQFRWTAPASASGDIVFYAAGCAGNNDFGTNGDYVYATSQTSNPPAANTPTPTRSPTATPTEPVITPTPLHTPGPCNETKVTLQMPAHVFAVNDECFLEVVICNASGETFTGEKLFAILDLYGTYYCAPTWSTSLDYLGDDIDFPTGESTVTVIPQFSWPSGAGAGEAVFWSALSNPMITSLISNVDSWEFRWQ